MSGEKRYMVYCHTNNVNGKKYIGTTSSSLGQRSKKNGRGYEQSRYFANAIKKYGWDSFSHEVLLSGLSEAEASFWEKYYICLFGTNDAKRGYNIQRGGINSGGMSEEGRRSMGLAHAGPDGPLAVPIASFDLNGNRLVDFPYIKAACEYYNLPDSSIGASLYSPNRTCHGMIFRYAKDVVGVSKMSDEYLNGIVRVRRYKGGKHVKCTEVVAFDERGNKKAEFQSMKEAAKFFGVYHGSISAAVKGHIKSVRGHYLRLKSDVGDASVLDVSNIYSKKDICVVQMSAEGNVLNTFSSLREAQKEVGGCHKAIKRSALSGKLYRGFLWKMTE